MDFFHGDLKIKITDNVYPPAEDSFMLADAAYEAGSVLEIGCGSGLVSIAWARKNKVLGVDINHEAVSCSKENAKLNNVEAEFIESDLFSNVSGKFDVILFNPPYLPTNKSEKLKGRINDAFDGGKDGRLVLDRFLDQFPGYLKKDGKLFLVQSSLNDLEKTRARLESLGYEIEIVAEEKFFFEKLFLIRATR